MSGRSSNLAPADDTELRETVRTVTNYAVEDVPDSDIDTHIQLAKLRIKNETGSDKFFSDDGLAQAVIFASAILLKSAVENYSISNYVVGGQEIDVSDVASADASQFKEWSSLVRDGLENSHETTRRYDGLRNTADYITGDSDYFY